MEFKSHLETRTGFKNEGESVVIGGYKTTSHESKEREGVERRGVGMSSDDSVESQTVRRWNVGEEGACVG